MFHERRGRGRAYSLKKPQKFVPMFVPTFDTFRISNQQTDFVINFNNEPINISTPYFSFRTSSKE